SQKSDPDLVTTGPYRLVRNPIYTGILLAAVGTATALNWWFLVVVGLAAAYFIYSATVEEKWLTERFPDTDPAYRRATKMLVPHIF
ncbi:MAG: isoprenylcysteine carboxylmethyltransferase family protein, partial [Acidimicrobiia bacterium]|nr:isoprenylcysteine carboxylmethyltransferase family protein [Acidimicrobiia bacterium]